MEVSRDFIVSKDNRLINSKYDLNLNEQKIVLLLASSLNPDDTELTKKEISIKDLAELLNVSSQNLYRDIPKITKNLISKVIEFTTENEKGQSELIQTAFLSTAKYNKCTGVATLGFSEELRPYLLELKGLFTSYKLDNALSLNSKYSIRIYEKCKSNAFKKGFTWSLEDIKKELCLTQKTYSVYGKMKEKILTPTFKEISDKTDLKLDFEEEKEGKKVVAIKIKVTQENIEKK